MNEKKIIPILPFASPQPEADEAMSDCSAAEAFALMVLGDSMEPEFNEGEVIIIEPEGLASDGSYVMAWVLNEWIFRQLRRDGEGWQLVALNPAYPALSISGLDCIRGVIIQKSKPGRRKENKRYVD
jgi:DNA polymerase V